MDPSTGINFAEYAAFAMDPAIQKCNTYYKEIKETLNGESKVEDIHPEAARYYNVIKKTSWITEAIRVRIPWAGIIINSSGRKAAGTPLSMITKRMISWYSPYSSEPLLLL